MKRCYKCSLDKPLDQFSKDSSRLDGHANKCKDCRKLQKARPHTEFIQIDHKICTLCKIDKPISEYRMSIYSSDGHTSQCKQCLKSEATKTKRHRNPDRKKYLYNRRITNIQDCKKYIIDYLLEHPCVDCGEDNIVCLDFDHIDPATKDNNVSLLVRRGTCLARVVEEIKKCDIRCANCHRKRTARQQDFWKLQYEPI